ncbi:MAG TPA: alpha/beta hydrolase, partial [Chloroflexota bacterium]|nr:alpha/beta hydrolase [Chloroflexota bacterium]
MVPDLRPTRSGTIIGRDSTPLFWQAWEAPSARICIAVAHGLGEHSGRYRRLAAAMVQRGISVFAVDLRGMGRSPGQRGYVPSWGSWVGDFTALYELAQLAAPKA